MYSESPFEKATHRDSKELLSSSKPESQPLSFWTFSYVTSGADGQAVPPKTDLNLRVPQCDKEENSSAAVANRCM